jgi:hypothetical protein
MMSTGPITQAATAFRISSKHPKSSSPDRHYMIIIPWHYMIMSQM